LFAQAARAAIDRYAPNPDIIHLNSWQTGLVALLLKRQKSDVTGPAPKITFAIYDAKEEALFDQGMLDEFRLGYEHFTPEGIEYYGEVSLQKAGVVFADLTMTCSPNYAQEIQTELAGGGLSGLYAAMDKKLVGVLCGLNNESWNPETDQRITATYDRTELEGKSDCKQALLRELGLPTKADAPLVAMIGPFSKRSGINLVLDTASQWLEFGFQMVFFGEDDDHQVNRQLKKLASKHSDSVSVQPYPNNLRQILAGVDALITPSLIEPTGLLQFKAMRYGVIPVVHAAGALTDTVVDFDSPTATGTGICFSALGEDGLLTALGRLSSLFKSSKKWRVLVQNTMRQEFSWETTAMRYEQLLSIHKD
ncbi:MAG: glycogen/starch synthase, partial [Pseudomonadota bacterium]